MTRAVLRTARDLATGPVLLLGVLGVLALNPSAYGAPPPAAAKPAAAGTAAPAATSAPSQPDNGVKKIDVDSLKQQYWKGNSPELGVVQNRIYTKAMKLSLGGFFGSMSANPFLDISNIGGVASFHFNEYLGVGFVYMKMTSKTNTAYDAFVNAAGFGANNNPVTGLMGGEIDWSLLYGKLSLLGKAILHFDLYALGGFGQFQTQNGNISAPWFGVGQQIYITTWASIRVDYRFAMYTENVVEQFRPAEAIGTVIGTRSVKAGIFTFGVNLLLF